MLIQGKSKGIGIESKTRTRNQGMLNSKGIISRSTALKMSAPHHVRRENHHSSGANDVFQDSLNFAQQTHLCQASDSKYVPDTNTIKRSGKGWGTARCHYRGRAEGTATKYLCILENLLNPCLSRLTLPPLCCASHSILNLTFLADEPIQN